MNILILLVASMTQAAIPLGKKVEPATLRLELESAGFVVSDVSCRGENLADCSLSLGPNESKDPSAIVAAHAYVNPASARQALLDELDAIEARLDAGTETASDRRRFMKIILKLSGLNKRP